MSKPTSDAEHARTAGRFCPNCGDGNIDPREDTISTAGPYAYIMVYCLDCHAMWLDTFKLIGYQELDLSMTKDFE